MSAQQQRQQQAAFQARAQRRPHPRDVPSLSPASQLRAAPGLDSVQTRENILRIAEEQMEIVLGEKFDQSFKQ
jgi:hypothetical protein